MSHVKFFVSMIDKKITDDSVVYLGSHNFTKAAWGKYFNNFKHYQVNNYELGVYFPPKPNSAALKS